MKHIIVIISTITIIVCSCKTPVPETYTWESPESVFVEDRNWADTLNYITHYANLEKTRFTIYCSLEVKSHISESIEYAFVFQPLSHV